MEWMNTSTRTRRTFHEGIDSARPRRAARARRRSGSRPGPAAARIIGIAFGRPHVGGFATECSARACCDTARAARRPARGYREQCPRSAGQRSRGTLTATLIAPVHYRGTTRAGISHTLCHEHSMATAISGLPVSPGYGLFFDLHRLHQRRRCPSTRSPIGPRRPGALTKSSLRASLRGRRTCMARHGANPSRLNAHLSTAAKIPAFHAR